MNLFALLLSVALAASPMSACGAPQTPSTGSSDAGGQLQVQTTGNVTFDLASDQIFDLHGDGTLRVTEHNGGTTTTLFTQGSQVTYTVNGANLPYDDDAKEWLRRVLAQRPTPPTPPTPPH